MKARVIVFCHATTQLWLLIQIHCFTLQKWIWCQNMAGEWFLHLNEMIFYERFLLNRIKCYIIWRFFEHFIFQVTFHQQIPLDLVCDCYVCNFHSLCNAIENRFIIKRYSSLSIIKYIEKKNFSPIFCLCITWIDGPRDVNCADLSK